MLEKLHFLQESDIRQVINFCGRSLIEQCITSFDETNEVIQRNTFKELEDINKPLYIKLNEMTPDELIELWALSLLGSELYRYKATEGFEEWIKCAKYRFNSSSSERIKETLIHQLVNDSDINLRYYLILATKFFDIPLITRVI